MGLQRGLGDVKDELQMFIESQKRKIDNEKRELNKAKAIYSPRDHKPNDDDQNERLNRDGYSKQSQRTVEAGGLDDRSAYERRQKEIKEEQRRDYKRYAAEKEFRRTGKIDPDLMGDTSPRGNNTKDRLSMPFKRSEVTTPDIVDAYAELLRKKRAEERMYREMYDDPDVEVERKVRFNESGNWRLRKDSHIDEEDPFQWAREKAKASQRQKSAGETRSQKPPEVDEISRSKSVPPTTNTGVFGSSESSDASKRKKEQYKRELELQIKEKEEQKLKEKLRRLGRISSSDDVVQAKTVESSPRSKDDPSERAHRDRPDSQLRSASQSRSQRRQIDDEQNFSDRQFTSRNLPRGDFNYRGMPGYDPYMQMMPGRFDMRMDPYFMQNAMYGGAAGYNGAMYGQNMPIYGQNPAMFGPSAAMMPRMDVNSDFRRGIESDRAPRREGQGTPRTPKSPRKQDTSRPLEKATALSKKSPRSKAAVGGVFGDSDSVDKDAERAAKLAYQEELKQQMKEKQAAKEREKKERERYDAKIEAEIEVYNPWGKSGGGAPVKDNKGNLITDLKAMHKVNEAGIIISPRAHTNDALLSSAMSSLPKDSPVLAALSDFQNMASSALPATTDVEVSNQKPSGRGAALLELKGESKNPVQKREQLDYQAYLKQQIEEKQRKKLEEEQKQKEEEQKENQRLEEQRIKMEQEFLLEQEKEKKKEEEIRAKNDEMRKIAEQKRQEAERQRKEMEEDRVRTIQKRSSEIQRKSYETGRKQPSPPIPALQKMQVDNTTSSTIQQYSEQTTQNTRYDRPKSRPLPTIAKQQKTEVSMVSHETQVSNPPSRREARSRNSQTHEQAPKTISDEIVDDNMRYLDSIRSQLLQVSKENERDSWGNSKASQERVIKQLAALRRQLSVEEHKVQTELEKNVEKYQEAKKSTSNRRNDADKVEIFERARIRKGSAQKRMAPKIYERRHADPKQADDFEALTDMSSTMDFRAKYPNKPVTSSELDLQQKEFIRLQEQKLLALRQAISSTSDQLMQSIGNGQLDAGKQRPGSKQSMLESDSKFINMDDSPTIMNSRTSTAKSARRRLDTDSLIDESRLRKPPTPGGYSVNSMTSQAIDDMAARNEARLRKLRGETGRDVTTPSDPDDIIDGFLNDNSNSDRRPRTNHSEKSLQAESERR